MTTPFLAELYLAQWLTCLFLLCLVWLIAGPARDIVGGLALFAFGAIWGTVGGLLSLADALPEEWINQDVWAVGSVQTLPRERTHALRFTFDITSLEYQQRAYPYSGRVQLNWYAPYPVLKSGQQWRLKLRLKPAHGSLNPGGFNYEKWLFSQGILAKGYVRDSGTASLLASGNNTIRIDRVRAKIEQFIRTQGLEYGGLINALSIGVRTGITQEQWRVFRDTGTAHLVAISGLHIGMVAGIAYFLGRLFWRHTLLVKTHYPAQNAARLVALMTALLYAALAGFSLPTLRALLMLLSYFLLQWLHRSPGILFTIGFVLLTILLFFPLAPLNSGFWLSFSAVSAIALSCSRISSNDRSGKAKELQGAGNRLTLRAKISRYFTSWWQVQAAVFVGLFPMVLFFFQQVSIIGLFANFIAIPLIATLVVPSVLLALLLLALSLPGLSAGLLSFADVLLGWLWPVLQGLSGLPFSTWVSGAPPLWAMGVSLVGVFILLRPGIAGFRVLGALGFLPLVVSAPPTLEPDNFKVHVLDVGQGLAVIVQTRQHALLYDAGVRYRSGFDSGSAIILPFLRQQQIENLDVAIASHDNLDHVGGMEAVLIEHPAAQRYSSGQFLLNSAPCEAGINWQWDGVSFSFVHPQAGSTGSDNNDSCVLKVKSRYGSALLTGDIERRAEQQILAHHNKEVADTDVLLVPHHGSKTSSTEAFIRAVNPQLAVVSAGHINRFRHPSNGTVERFIAAEILMQNTASSGWLEIEFNQYGIFSRPMRERYRRYWVTPKTAFNAGGPARSLEFAPYANSRAQSP